MGQLQQNQTAPKAPRVVGLDALRFALAAWVVLAHIGMPSNLSAYAKGHLGMFQALLFFDGNAAVMVFFVVSGFCIHLPFVGQTSVDTRSFYLRREIRILPPVLAMFALGFVVHDFRFVDVLWSLVCEEVYYFLYPLILRLYRRFGFPKLIAGCTLIAAVLIGSLVRSNATDLQSQSYAVAWMMALPVWLLGVQLAEVLSQVRTQRISTPAIWSWRASVFLLSICMQALSHKGIPIAYFDLPFGAICYFWLTKEIAYWENGPPPKLLQRLGLASYSLYLGHLIVISRARYFTGDPLHFWPWVLALLLICLLTFLLYVLVERPSHHFARKFSAIRKDRQATNLRSDPG